MGPSRIQGERLDAVVAEGGERRVMGFPMAWVNFGDEPLCRAPPSLAIGSIVWSSSHSLTVDEHQTVRGRSRSDVLPTGGGRRATSGRSRSLATTVFFEAELFGVHEVPHRSIIHFKAALSELGRPDLSE